MYKTFSDIRLERENTLINETPTDRRKSGENVLLHSSRDHRRLSLSGSATQLPALSVKHLNYISYRRKSAEDHFQSPKLNTPLLRRNTTQLPQVTPDYLGEYSTLEFFPILKPHCSDFLSCNSPSKHEEAKVRREMQRELEQLQIVENFDRRHSNRPSPASLLKCFETSKRKRFLLKIIILHRFIHSLLCNNLVAITSVSKAFQNLQNEHFRMIEQKQLQALQATNEYKQKMQINRKMLLLFIKWRLKRRVSAARLLQNYLKKIFFGKWQVKMLCKQLKKSLRLIQRSFQAWKSCREGRLFAMKLKLAKVYGSLRIEAEQYKKKQVGSVFWNGDKLPHPLFNLDLSLPLEGEIQDKQLLAYIDTKRKQWLFQMDFERKKMQAKRHDPCIASLKQQYPQTDFHIYKETSYKIILDLIQTIFEEKYPEVAARDKIFREQLKTLPKSLSNASKVDALRKILFSAH